jgi:hypothetical protein
LTPRETQQVDHFSGLEAAGAAGCVSASRAILEVRHPRPGRSVQRLIELHPGSPRAPAGSCQTKPFLVSNFESK